MIYLALLGLGALDAAGYSIIAPVVPSIADDTGSGPAVIGALVTCFAVGQIVAYPVAGRWVQRRHASFVLWTALGLMILGDLGFVLGDSLAVYFPARLLMGLGAGGLWIGLTFATLERFPGDEYRRLTGLMAAYAVGGIAGPALGSIGGVDGPFLAHLGLVLAACFVVALLGPPHERIAFGSDRSALRTGGFWLASASIMVVAITLGALEGPLPLHFSDELSQAGIAGLYIFTSVVAGASGAFGGRLPARPNVIAGTALLTAGTAAAGLTGAVEPWVLALAVAAVGFGLCQSGSMGILLETVGPERIVLAMVVWSQLFAIGYLLGPAAGGAVAEALGFGAIGLIPLVGALLVAAALLRTAGRQSAVGTLG